LRFIICPSPSEHASGSQKSYQMSPCYFLYFNGPIEDQLSQNVLDRSSPRFKISIHTGGMINAIIFLRSLKRHCHDNNFRREEAKIGIPHLYSVRWNSSTDGRISPCMCAITPPMIPVRSDKNLVNFGLVIPEFAGAFAPGGPRAELCHVARILPRIPSHR